MKQNPRTMALAYRIWAYCEPREWDVTIPELAEEMRESVQAINGILRTRGWLNRVRLVTPDHHKGPLYAAGAVWGNAASISDSTIEEVQSWL